MFCRKCSQNYFREIFSNLLEFMDSLFQKISIICLIIINCLLLMLLSWHCKKLFFRNESQSSIIFYSIRITFTLQAILGSLWILRSAVACEGKFLTCKFNVKIFWTVSGTPLIGLSMVVKILLDWLGNLLDNRLEKFHLFSFSSVNIFTLLSNFLVCIPALNSLRENHYNVVC